MTEFTFTVNGKVLRFAAKTKAEAEAVISKMAEAHTALMAHHNELMADAADDAEPGAGPDSSATNSKSQRAASLRVGTVAAPTACSLADAIRDHYAAADLRAAAKGNTSKKSTSREDAIRAAMKVDAPTK